MTVRLRQAGARRAAAAACCLALLAAPVSAWAAPAWTATAPTADPATAARPAAASVWSSFEAMDLEGRRWTSAELEGRVVLLDFWATWCAPCLAALPTLRRAAADFGDRDFVIIGISLDRAERRDLERFLRHHRIDWPQLHDGRGVDGPLARRFGVTAVPRTFLVDRRGRIVGVDLGGAALLAALPALLAAEAR